jgi:hypothetical protein
MTPRRWFHNAGRWAHPIVYVRDSGAVYTRYTLTVDRQPSARPTRRYVYTVHDGSVMGPIVASGYAPWLWLAQWRAGWAVPS